LRCQVGGCANQRCTAAGKGAGTPCELVGITRDHPDVLNLHIQLISDDLGKYSVVRLSLGAVTGRHCYLAAGADGDLAAFVRSNSSAFGKGDHADTQTFAFGSRFWLNLLAEFVVIDTLEAFLVIAQVIAAVEYINDEVLSDDACFEW